MAENSIEEWPRALTPELRDILGFMCFQLGKMAHAYQAVGRFLDGDGCELQKRAEDEQAFMLHRFLTHWFDHGVDWRETMEAELEEVLAQLKAKAAAHG
jgi:hypothetical protein